MAAATEQASYMVDAVCPLVTKVHHEVKVRANKGYRIIYVGHEDHEEAVGTMAVAPKAIHPVEDIASVEALPEFEEPVALLAQTTLSHRDWEGVLHAARDRFPDMWTPGRSDLCFATTNRQAALTAMVEQCDAVVIVGSANSSNTMALEKLARELGCGRVFRVNRASELPDDISGVVGLTAGASAPEELINEVLDRLAPLQGIEEVSITDEDEYFPPAPQPPRSDRGLRLAGILQPGRTSVAHPDGGSQGGSQRRARRAYRQPLTATAALSRASAIPDGDAQLLLNPVEHVLEGLPQLVGVLAQGLPAHPAPVVDLGRG